MTIFLLDGKLRPGDSTQRQVFLVGSISAGTPQVPTTPPDQMIMYKQIRTEGGIHSTHTSNESRVMLDPTRLSILSKQGSNSAMCHGLGIRGRMRSRFQIDGK